jgi:bifunctional non-homologous end joining protein LigD
MGPARSRPNPLTTLAGKQRAEIEVDGSVVRLTNLNKVFWPDLGLTKRDLLEYYADISRPDWVRVCPIEHASGSVIDFAVVDDMASLLWVINLGCIDLNPWYAACDDVDRPDYLHFDLDPAGEIDFRRVLQSALCVREILDGLKMSG